MKNEKTGLTEKEIQEAIKKAEYFGISQRLILFHFQNRKFLLIKNANTNLWEIPGGIVDKEEDLVGALKREISEELGAIEYQILGVISATNTKYEISGKKYPVTILGYVGSCENEEITLSREHSEYSWKTVDEIIALNDDIVATATKDFIKAAADRLKEREYLNDLQRLQADFANYKKRQQESQKELAGYLIERLVLDLIPVLDNFRMATNHVPETSKSDPWVVGIQYIEKQLEDVLTANGMQVIEVKEGDVFDPSIHEAISDEQETKDEEESMEQSAQTVAKILQKGYKIGDKVIRPAKVSVK